MYCKKWNIIVNTDKTKVVVFRNGWQPVNSQFLFDGDVLEIVDSYIYLGMLLHSNGKFLKTQKRISQQGARALSSLLNTFRQVFIGTNQKCYLFNTMVGSVLNYASEIWGFHRANDIEVVHNRFCRSVLNVGKTTPSVFLYGELGHLPMYIFRKYRIVKYWLRIINEKPSMVYDIYKLLCADASNGKSNWASSVKKLLFSLGLGYIWLNQDTINVSFDFIKCRINDQYYQDWYASVSACEKLSLYSSYKLDFCMEQYLEYDFNVTILTKLRSGTLKLNVETGRYDNTQRDLRICKCCNLNTIENEYHFVLSCSAYRTLRYRFLPKYYCSWPNMYKLKRLMSCKSNVLTKKFCNFLNSAWKLRSHIVG